MFGNSREVASGQREAHPRLAEIVRRHLETPFRKPPSETSRRAFDVLAAQLAGDSRPRVLDSGCGTGASTLELARRHRDAVVIGVDKSQARLDAGLRHFERSEVNNAALLRCDLVDFWLLAAQAAWRFEAQYFLYPNPWPKPEYVMRRWPGHAVLPSVLACGGVFELRTNWEVYAREWALALDVAGRETVVEPLVSEGLTPFETKYATSGHALWRVLSPG